MHNKVQLYSLDIRGYETKIKFEYNTFDYSKILGMVGHDMDSIQIKEKCYDHIIYSKIMTFW